MNPLFPGPLSDFPWARPPAPEDSPGRPGNTTQEFDRSVRELFDLLAARVRNHRGTLEEYVLLGRLLRLRGHPHRAFRLHQGLLARPRLPKRVETDVHVELGYDLLAGRVKDFGQAHFEKALAAEKHNLPALEGLAEAYERQDKLPMAARILEKLVRLGRDEKTRLAYVLTETARRHLAEGLRAKARRIVERALRCDARCPHARLTLADIYADAGRYEDAIGTLKAFLKDRPSHSLLALRRLEDAHYRMHAFPEYEHTLRQLIRESPDNFYLHHSLARHLRKKRQDTEALEFLRRAFEINPLYPNSTRERLELLAEGPRAETLRDTLHQFFSGYKRSRRFICPNCRARYVPVTWHCGTCGFRGLFDIRYELPAP